MVNLVALQMTSTPIPEENFAAVDSLLAPAKLAQGSIVVLPECFSCFGISDKQRLAVCEPPTGGKYTKMLQHLAYKYQCHLFAGTMPMTATQSNATDKCFAACRYINGEHPKAAQQQAIYNKIHLFDATVEDNTQSYRESATTVAGDDIVVVTIAGLRVGVAVCYDVRFAALFDAMGTIDVLVLPAAFTAKTGAAHWHTLIRARAIEKQCYVVAANQVGTHANGRQTYGHSMVVSPWGDIMSQCQDQCGLAVAQVDIDALHKIKQAMPVANHAKFRSHFVD